MRLELATPCLIATLFSASSAHADPPDPDVAFGLSAGSTAASYALAALCSDVAYRVERCRVVKRVAGVGVLLAPSLGHWYAGDWWTRGLGLRAVGVGVGIIGYLTGATAYDAATDVLSSEKVVAAVVLAVVGGGLLVWGTADDIATARSRAREDDTAVVAPIVIGRF